MIIGMLVGCVNSEALPSDRETIARGPNTRRSHEALAVSKSGRDACAFCITRQLNSRTP